MSDSLLIKNQFHFYLIIVDLVFLYFF